jgi:hypothetical protein
MLCTACSGPSRQRDWPVCPWWSGPWWR